MSRYVTSEDLFKALREAGLELPDNCGAVTIELRVGFVARVTIEQHATIDSDVLKVTRRYRLVEEPPK